MPTKKHKLTPDEIQIKNLLKLEYCKKCMTELKYCQCFFDALKEFADVVAKQGGTTDLVMIPQNLYNKIKKQIKNGKK
jgi:hypothetical protein